MPGKRKDKVLIEVQRFVDFDGEPTCAANFDNDEVCMFLTVSLVKEKCRGITGLVRRKFGDGSLIPCDECLVWKMPE